MKPQYHINMTPFIDILLVLLIVLMLSARTLAEEELNLSLPRISRKSQETNSQNTAIELILNRNEDIFINGEELTKLSQLPEKLSLFSEEQPILIKADANLKYETIFSIIQQIHLANFSKISLLGLEKE